jgi:hypothetical protein
MTPSNLSRLRKICLSFPEAIEVEAWGSPTFRVGKIFAMHGANHHGGREAVWVKSKHFTQDMLVRGMPQRYFVPAYVGPGGWTGVYLDARTDWPALTMLLRDAYRMTASKKLVALLGDDDATPTRKPKKAVAAKRSTKSTMASRPKQALATKRKRSS